MRLDGFQLLGESNARGSTQHVVRKNKGDCHFSEQFKGFSTRGRSENRISCPLKHSLADPQIGFVVLYAEDGSLGGLVTRGTFDRQPIRHTGAHFLVDSHDT